MALESAPGGRPILVTGSHRSGTTWTGRMLCLSGQAGYVHEPFNPDRRPGWTGGAIPYWFLYVSRENEEHYRPIVERVLNFHYPVRRNLADVRSVKGAGLFALDLSRSVRYRLRRPRPLLKDPIALFSAEWLAHSFDVEVVVMIRHPAAFAASVKRLGWRFKFRGWLAQDALLRDWLHPFEAQMRRCAAEDVDIIEQAIVMWSAMHHVIKELRDRHHSWSFIRHEDLAAAPLDGFQDLYRRLQLQWSERVRSKIIRHSNTRNPAELKGWRHVSVKRNSSAVTRSWARHLTNDEICRIRAGVEPLASAFYSDQDWL